MPSIIEMPAVSAPELEAANVPGAAPGPLLGLDEYEGGHHPHSNPLTDPKNPPLDGNSFDTINAVAATLLVLLPAAAVLGWLLDRRLCRKSTVAEKYRKENHPPAWVVCLLVSSYGLLIPGVSYTLFSFNIVANLMDIVKLGIGPGGGLNEYPSTTESMFGLVKLLHSTGAWPGVILVVLYAIVIPVVKLTALIFGEWARNATKLRRTSYRCIQIVQSISKWACPDMFAYILLMYLVRSLNHPELLRAAGELDIGFTCFSLFCIGSTIASLGIHLGDKNPGCARIVGKVLGKRWVLPLVAPLAVAFFVLLGLGAHTPIMSLRVEVKRLYHSAGGPIPDQYSGMIDMLHLPELCNSDVSIVQNIQKSFTWMGQGEVNSILSFTMLAVFVLGITMLDMLLLVVAAGFIHFDVVRTIRGVSPMGLAWAMKKLSMLDVLIMGVFVVNLVFAMYKKAGVVVSPCHGLVLCAAAEAVHYVTYYLVKGAVDYWEPELGRNPSEDSNVGLSSTGNDGFCQGSEEDGGDSSNGDSELSESGAE